LFWSRSEGILKGESAEFPVLAVTVSMLVAPLSFAAHDRLLKCWLERRSAGIRSGSTAPNPRSSPATDATGRSSARIAMAGIPFTAMVANYQQVDFVRVRQQGFTRRASRLSCSESARRARPLFVPPSTTSRLPSRLPPSSARTIPISRSSRAPAIASTTIGCGPRHEAIELETFLSSIETARQALEQLGMDRARAERAVSLFREHDARQMEAQYAVRQDEAQLIQTATQAAAQLQELFEADAKESGEAMARSGTDGI
jgi:glutathione-regulated potassium-efflux system protein KefB